MLQRLGGTCADVEEEEEEEEEDAHTHTLAWDNWESKAGALSGFCRLVLGWRFCVFGVRLWNALLTSPPARAIFCLSLFRRTRPEWLLRRCVCVYACVSESAGAMYISEAGRAHGGSGKQSPSRRDV